MKSHRGLIASLAVAGLLVGLVGCELVIPPERTYPASKSESNMHNSTWQVNGEEKPQVPAPEQGPAPVPPGAAKQ